MQTPRLGKQTSVSRIISASDLAKASGLSHLDTSKKHLGGPRTSSHIGTSFEDLKGSTASPHPAANLRNTSLRLLCSASGTLVTQAVLRDQGNGTLASPLRMGVSSGQALVLLPLGPERPLPLRPGRRFAQTSPSSPQGAGTLDLPQRC